MQEQIAPAYFIVGTDQVDAVFVPYEKLHPQRIPTKCLPAYRQIVQKGNGKRKREDGDEVERTAPPGRKSRRMWRTVRFHQAPHTDSGA